MRLQVPLSVITETIHRRVCPLYSLDDRDRVHVVGSAVPFQSGASTFLITAAHVCLALAPKAPIFVWGVAEKPRTLIGPRVLWNYRPGTMPDIDLVLIGLSRDDAADLAGLYSFSTPDAIGSIMPQTPGVHYLIAGYPSSRNRVKRGTADVPSKATYLVTGKIVSVESKRFRDKSDEHHFGLSFDGDPIQAPDGKLWPIPTPQGMSGGGVWRMNVDVVTREATLPCLVGIGIEFHKSGQLFLASRIENAIPLTHDLAKILDGEMPKDLIHEDR